MERDTMKAINVRPTLRDLFPKLSEEELHSVEDTFYSYLDILFGIYERLKRDRPELFDTLISPSYHEAKVDSPKTNRTS